MWLGPPRSIQGLVTATHWAWQNKIISDFRRLSSWVLLSFVTSMEEVPRILEFIGANLNMFIMQSQTEAI